MTNGSIGGWNTDLFKNFLNDFCRGGVKPIALIGAWLQMQELKDLMAKSSWNYPYAAFCRDENYKKLMPDFWKEGVFADQREGFVDFYIMVSSMSLDDFLAAYPTLVKQPYELAALRSVLEQDGAPYTDEKQWGYCIFEAICTYEDYKRKNCEDIDMTKVFQGYLKSRNITMPDDAAFSLLAFVVMYPFSNRKRKEKVNAATAYRILKKANCSPLKMLEIYKDVHEIIKKDTKYGSPARYIKAAKGIENFRIDIGDEEAIDNACKLLKSLKTPSDFVGVVMERMNGENSRIEMGFVQVRFLETIRQEDCILVINPSVYFVRTWPESLRNRTTFCVMSELERLLLQNEFSQATFCLADTVEVSSFTKTLYFPRPTEDDTQKELIRRVCRRTFESTMKTVGLMMLISPKDELLSMVKEHYKGIYIDELPRMTSDVEPKRRILVTAAAGEGSNGVELKRQLMLFSRDTGLLGYSDQIPKDAEQLCLIFAPKKRNADVRNGVERQAKYVDFSRDIRIWYKQSDTYNGKIRVEASLYTLPTDKQKRRNKNQRGAKLPGTSVSKVCANEEEKAEWLIHQYPYLEKVQSALAGLFGNKKQSICLKTAWYLSLDLDRYSRKLTQEMGAVELMPYFGDMQVTETNPEAFRTAMEMLRKTRGLTQEQEKIYWNILDNLFSALRKNGYCEMNPVSSINAEFRPRHTKESIVRDALTKKSFSAKEIRTLYQSISAQIKPSDSLYLGMLLRLLTGLRVDVLCALKWGDLKRISGKDTGYQLWIRRKVSSDGKECVGLDTNEEYRRYPLMDPVAEYLLDRWDYILNVLRLKETVLRSKYILSSDAELTDELCPIPQPNQWKRLGKKVIDQLQIKDVVLDLPSDDGGKETILTSYHGDVFNTNFRYDLKYFCHISRAEERYLMGLQQTDTYSKHYLDFTNDALQQRIITKLNRMYAIIADSDSAPALKAEHNPKNGLAVVLGTRGYCSQIDLDIQTEEDVNLIITAESQNGEQIAFCISEVQNVEESE